MNLIDNFKAESTQAFVMVNSQGLFARRSQRQTLVGLRDDYSFVPNLIDATLFHNQIEERAVEKTGYKVRCVRVFVASAKWICVDEPSSRNAAQLMMNSLFDNQARGSGKTTMQIVTAPLGSIFVWNGSSIYISNLIKKHERSDLEVMSLNQLLNNYEAKFIGMSEVRPVILDHAVDYADPRVVKFMDFYNILRQIRKAQS